MRLSNARLLTVPNGAHQSFDEYPEVVIPAIDQFLKGSWPAAAEKVTTLVPNSPMALISPWWQPAKQFDVR